MLIQADSLAYLVCAIAQQDRGLKKFSVHALYRTETILTSSGTASRVVEYSRALRVCLLRTKCVV